MSGGQAEDRHDERCASQERRAADIRERERLELMNLRRSLEIIRKQIPVTDSMVSAAVKTLPYTENKEAAFKMMRTALEAALRE